MESRSSFLERYGAVFECAPARLKSDTLAQRMYALCSYLDEERQKYNLTAIKDPAEVMKKHVYDCLTAMDMVLEHLFGNAVGENLAVKTIRYLDVGSGAGFPALPAAALLDEYLNGKSDSDSTKSGTKIYCRSAEASLKKCGFMNRAAALMGLKCAENGGEGFAAKQARAEEIGRDKIWREKWDIVTARAVADLPVLMELCLPLTAVGGVFAAMKGSAADDELARCKNAAAALGAVLEADLSYALPDGVGDRRVLIFRKTTPTAAKYPRAYGKITSKPL